jgi:hypothetical protein
MYVTSIAGAAVPVVYAHFVVKVLLICRQCKYNTITTNSKVPGNQHVTQHITQLLASSVAAVFASGFWSFALAVN